MCTRRTLTFGILLKFAKTNGGHFFFSSDTLLVGVFEGFSLYFYTTEFHKGLMSVKSSNFFYML